MNLDNRVTQVSLLSGQINQSSSQSNTAEISLGAIRERLQEVGFSTEGLSRLNLEQTRILIDQIQNGSKQASLIISMFNAVSLTSPEYTNKFIDTISKYSGSLPILREFLRPFHTMDPFIATARAQILILPAANLATARGVSGRIHKGLVYGVYDTANPSASIGYLSKKQAITKIFDAFCPEKMSIEVQAKTRTRRNSILKEKLKDLNLSNLEENPSLASESGVELITRNFEVYSELRKAICACKEQLANLIYSSSFVLSEMKSLKVAQDPGRHFYGWFEEHIKENKNVPIGLILAYERLRDPDIHLTAQEENDYTQGLLAYQRLNSYINKQAAMGGILEDLSTYESLPSNDPLRFDERIESAKEIILSSLSDNSPEISISEFGRLVELSGMLAFRKAMNQRTIDLYRDDLKKALVLFEFVSFENGKWREDVLGDAVPMDRLKNGLYGVKIGVSDPSYGVDKKQAILGQRDFKAIIDLQFLIKVTPDQDKLLHSISIPKFQAMLEGVIVAYRKASYLDRQFLAYLESSGIPASSINRHQIGESLNLWKPVVIAGTKYSPAEKFEISNVNLQASTLTLHEIYQRIVDRKEEIINSSFERVKIYDKINSELSRTIPIGLATEETSSFLGELAAKVTSLIPSSTLINQLDRATRIAINPMVARVGFDAARIGRVNFLFPKEIESINNLLSVESIIKEKCADYLSELSELAEQTHRNIFEQICSGGLVSNNGNLCLSLRAKHFAEFVGVNRLFIDTQEISYYEPQKVKQAINRLENEYIRLDQLESDWLNKAKIICSSAGRTILSKVGLNLVDNETFRIVRYLREGSRTYISRNFVNAINRIASGDID